MTCYSVFNVQGLCPQTKPSKMPYIRDILFDKNQAFIGLTETWLSENHLKAELDITGYFMFKSDRKRENSKRGRLSGGVCLYAREDLASTFKLVIQFSNGVVEMLADHSKCLNLCIIIVYRQPDQQNNHRSLATHFKQAICEINEYLSSIQGVLPHLILAGNFNLPHGNWSGGLSSRSIVGDERKMADSLIELSINFGLSQCITSPTHMHGNTLDLVFVNNGYLCHHSKCLEVIPSVSHHRIVEVHSTFPFNKKIEQKIHPPPYKGMHKFNFFDNNIKWDAVNVAFESCDWEEVFTELNIDNMVDKFVEITEIVCSNHIPTKLVLHKSKSKNSM